MRTLILCAFFSRPY